MLETLRNATVNVSGTVTVGGARRLWRHKFVCIWNAPNRRPNRKCQHMTTSVVDNCTRFTVSGCAMFQWIFHENDIDLFLFLKGVKMYHTFIIVCSKLYTCLLISLRNYQILSTCLYVTWRWWCGHLPTTAVCLWGHSTLTVHFSEKNTWARQQLHLHLMMMSHASCNCKCSVSKCLYYDMCIADAHFTGLEDVQVFWYITNVCYLYFLYLMMTAICEYLQTLWLLPNYFG